MSRKGHIQKSTGRGAACKASHWNGVAIMPLESFRALRHEDQCSRCRALLVAPPVSPTQGSI